MALQRIKILPESGSGTFDVRSCDRAFASLKGNLTLSIVGIDNGEMANLWVTQDATGNRTVTIRPYGGGANVTVGSGTFNTTANSTTRLSIININNRLYIEYAGAGGTASSVSFANVTGKPTTLSGYGITDAIPLSQKGTANGVAVLDGNALIPVGIMGQGSATGSTYLRGDRTWVAVPFADISSKPTTLSGYGITDAIPTSQKGAANGVATLGSNTLIPAAQLGTGTANATTTLHGDNTWS